MRVDIDALRAARSEQEQEPHEIVVRGETFYLPPYAPLSVLLLSDKEDIGALLAALLGDEQLQRFRALEPQPDALDFELIANNIGEIYGNTLGESSASDEPSASNGRPSKVTSNASTGSTSPISSGARPPAPEGSIPS